MYSRPEFRARSSSSQMTGLQRRVLNGSLTQGGGKHCSAAATLIGNVSADLTHTQPTRQFLSDQDQEYPRLPRAKTVNAKE